MARSPRLSLVAVVGLALMAASVVGAGLLASWPPLADVVTAVMDDVRPRLGAWRLLRGALRYLAVPALILLGVVVLGVGWNRDRRRALVFGACFLMSNLLVQAVKHGLVPSAEGLNPLSGHAGVAGGLALSWYAFFGRHRDDHGPGSGVRVGGALALVAATGGGVVLTGWHSLLQVLCPLGVAAGSAMIGQAAMGYGASRAVGSSTHPATTRSPAHARAAGPALAVLGALTAVAGLTTVWVLPRLAEHPLPAAVVCVATVVAVTAGALAAIHAAAVALDGLER